MFMLSRKWKLIFFGLALGILVAAAIAWNDRNTGVVIDQYKGVEIYDNGPLAFKSHGRHYSASGYYWGQKWQCVEFVKRFYDEAMGHQMPDVWGHAKDFFDPLVEQGGLNAGRGLAQFRNGGNEAPAVDDLVVFDGGFGHVAIVREVGSNFVEVAQQNIYRRPRARLEVTATNGNFVVRPSNVLGWLRKK
jgi:surface antigen